MKRILIILAALFVGLIGVVTTPVAASAASGEHYCDPANPDPDPCESQAEVTGLHDANYINIGSKPIVMCRDWTTAYGDGRNEPGTCKYTSDGGAQRTLYQNQTTNGTFGWTDTDGFYVNSGYNVRVRLSAAYAWQYYYATGWRKKGGCNDCRFQIQMVSE